MGYTPSDRSAIDFLLQTPYSLPSRTAVNFNLALGESRTVNLAAVSVSATVNSVIDTPSGVAEQLSYTSWASSALPVGVAAGSTSVSLSSASISASAPNITVSIDGAFLDLACPFAIWTAEPISLLISTRLDAAQVQVGAVDAGVYASAVSQDLALLTSILSVSSGSAHASGTDIVLDSLQASSQATTSAVSVSGVNLSMPYCSALHGIMDMSVGAGAASVTVTASSTSTSVSGAGISVGHVNEPIASAVASISATSITVSATVSTPLDTVAYTASVQSAVDTASGVQVVVETAAAGTSLRDAIVSSGAVSWLLETLSASALIGAADVNSRVSVPASTLSLASQAKSYTNITVTAVSFSVPYAPAAWSIPAGSHSYQLVSIAKEVARSGQKSGFAAAVRKINFTRGIQEVQLVHDRVQHEFDSGPIVTQFDSPYINRMFAADEVKRSFDRAVTVREFVAPVQDDEFTELKPCQ